MVRRLKNLRWDLAKALPVDTLKKWIAVKKGGVVLMYHSIRDVDQGYNFCTSLRAFEKQMAVISEIFNVLSIEEFLYKLTKDYKTQQKPFAVITFDDGFRDNLENAAPILRKHQFPFCIFVI